MADFDSFRGVLSECNLLGKLELNNDIDENVQEITEALLLAAGRTIPNKIVTIRPSTHPWITSHIRQLIRKRKHIFRQFKRTSDNQYWDKYKYIRNKIVSDIRKSKNDYFDKLDALLSTETSNMKLFWKTSKQLLNVSKSSSSIPTLVLNNEYAEDDHQKANMLNTYFTSQAVVTDDCRPLPELLPAQSMLTSILVSSQDV
ncbi:MAG: hypothetical protein JAY74_00010, partial [Candidatus Thiodiazotropha taylori]|nr:hypothetical protein [Candidatus Thiodiazotropha taylori]